MACYLQVAQRTTHQSCSLLQRSLYFGQVSLLGPLVHEVPVDKVPLFQQQL
jgi:hypothetical protein